MSLATYWDASLCWRTFLGCMIATTLVIVFRLVLLGEAGAFNPLANLTYPMETMILSFSVIAQSLKIYNLCNVKKDLEQEELFSSPQENDPLKFKSSQIWLDLNLRGQFLVDLRIT